VENIIIILDAIIFPANSLAPYLPPNSFFSTGFMGTRIRPSSVWMITYCMGRSLTPVFSFSPYSMNLFFFFFFGSPTGFASGKGRLTFPNRRAPRHGSRVEEGELSTHMFVGSGAWELIAQSFKHNQTFLKNTQRKQSPKWRKFAQSGHSGGGKGMLYS
jgi:hypothetical protein